MNNSSTFNILFNVQDGKVQASVNKLNAGLINVNKAVVNVDKGFAKTINNINSKLKNVNFDSILNNVSRFSTSLNSLNEPGIKLSTSMADLSAITGVTGGKLKEIEGYARQNAKTFGGDAAESVEAYKLVLSKLSPEIAKSPVALKAMGNAISTLSKGMKGDAVGASDVLTTAMNQYQVSTDDPIAASKTMAEMMNVMTAAAQAGSAELPEIKSALEQSGMAAKMAGVSFAETNAAIQVLDKAGKKGAEGGVALRNVMAILSEGRFLPKDVKAELASAGIDVNKLGDKSLSLADRMKPLKGIMNDSALVTKLFGKENSNAALALISGITEQERLTTAITGTNAAYDYAAIVMESPAEKQKRLQASVDDFKISLFNGSNGVLAYAGTIGTMVNDISGLVPLFTAAGNAVMFLTSKEKLMAFWGDIVAAKTAIWAGVQWVLNAAFWANPLTWIIAAIVALIAVIAYVVYKTDGWGAAWKHVVNGAKLLWQAFVASGKWQFDTMVNGFMIGINLIKKGWYSFKNSMGIGDKADNNKAIAEINADTEARKKAIVDGAKKAVGLAIAAKNEFAAAGGSLKWNSSKKEKSTAETLGIAEPKTPGAMATGGGGGAKGGNAGGGKTTEAIATGGTKNTQISINLKDLIGVLNINAATFKEGVNSMEAQVTDALIRVLGSAQATAG